MNRLLSATPNSDGIGFIFKLMSYRRMKLLNSSCESKTYHDILSAWKWGRIRPLNTWLHRRLTKYIQAKEMFISLKERIQRNLWAMNSGDSTDTVQKEPIWELYPFYTTKPTTLTCRYRVMTEKPVKIDTEGYKSLRIDTTPALRNNFDSCVS